MSQVTAESEAPVVDPLARMTADSLETSTLDAQTIALVRIAALVAIEETAAEYTDAGSQV